MYPTGGSYTLGQGAGYTTGVGSGAGYSYLGGAGTGVGGVQGGSYVGGAGVPAGAGYGGSIGAGPVGSSYVGGAGVGPGGTGYLGGAGVGPGGAGYLGSTGGGPFASDYSGGTFGSYGPGGPVSSFRSGAYGPGYGGGAACNGVPGTGACGTGVCGVGIPGAGGCREPGSADCGTGCGSGCGPGSGPGTGCCGGTAIGGGVMSYVGPGGEYCQETTYRYVGRGAGTYSPTVLPRCNYCLCLIPLLLLLLLVPLVLLLLSSSGQTTTTPAPVPVVAPAAPAGPAGTCTIWGDPHLMTFDGKHNDFYSQGEYWIVKSSTVHIQGRYLPTKSTHGLSVTKEIAISGPFLNDNQGGKHILRVGARTATWDGTPILTGFPSQWQAPAGGPPVQAQLNDHGELLQKGREGKALHIVHLQLPRGVSIQVNRWTLEAEGDYINVKINMPKQPGQDGHCGNFNGDAADDDRLQIRARVGKTGVPQSELLFHTKTPVVVANRPDINDCPSDKLDQAHELCKQREGTFIPSADCLVDVCFGGKGFAHQA